jgi:ABC-2 type transport system ATP-binding protein
MTEAVSTPPPAPLLVAEEARIAVDGVVAIDRLTFSAIGDHLLFAGDPAALFAAITGVPLSSRRGARPVLTGKAARAALAATDDLDEELPGEAYVVAGALRLAGRSVADATHIPIMGAATLDPPLPPAWSAEEYVAWGARLSGTRRSAANDLAAAALARVGLLPARKRLTSVLSLAERRALVLAQAIVTAPEILIAEAPLAGLEGAAAAFVLDALVQATEGRRAIFSVTRIDPASPEGRLARAASHVIVLAGGEIALEGTPAELFSGVRVYTLTVHKNAEPFRAELALRGIPLRGGPHRFSVELAVGGSTRDIVAAAQAARAALVEMVPLIG